MMMVIIGMLWGIAATVNLWYHFIRSIVEGGDTVSTGYRQNAMETLDKSLSLNRDNQN
jgi:hypothetical protein